ncbi:MAG: hypothetical protein KGI60_04480, partial [Patescibacteria group bacterium]|nr:hypothetical protein [Patescibacteria group bacterium]
MKNLGMRIKLFSVITMAVFGFLMTGGVAWAAQVTISSSTTSGFSSSGSNPITETATADGANLSVDDITNALNAGTDIIIDSGNRDIVVQNAITKSGGGS